MSFTVLLESLKQEGQFIAIGAKKAVFYELVSFFLMIMIKPLTIIFSNKKYQKKIQINLFNVCHLFYFIIIFLYKKLGISGKKTSRFGQI